MNHAHMRHGLWIMASLFLTIGILYATNRTEFAFFFLLFALVR